MNILAVAALIAVVEFIVRVGFIAFDYEFGDFHAFSVMMITAVVAGWIVLDVNVGIWALSFLLAETWRMVMTLIASLNVRMMIVPQRKF
jgi:hypothetical protein